MEELGNVIHNYRGGSVVHSMKDTQRVHKSYQPLHCYGMWGDDAIVSGWAQAGAYFNKIQCFCFEEQRLRPHEKIDMPVTEPLPISYFVSPTSWERRGG